MTIPTTMTQISQQMRTCIDTCLDCSAICQETIMHCLQRGGRHADPNHLRLLMDCSHICQTSGSFMLRSSNFYWQLCGICADVSNQCAQSCEQLSDDQQMKDCAEVCRRTSQLCQQMSSGTRM